MIISWLGLYLLATACVTPPENTPAQPRPTCVPATPEANPYFTHIQDGVVNIYRNYSNNAITYENARQAAFLQLGINTEHWSDYVDIAIDENNMVRIVVTYLDPVLIQYVVLNQIFFTPYPSIGLVEFDAEIRKQVSKLGERKEMLFVVTITSTNYRAQAFNNAVLTVDIPIEEMALINAADVRVTPTHEDHILDELIDISHRPVFGIVGYPLGVMNQEQQCIWIVDQYTNSLTLDVPRVFLGGNDQGPQFWNIPYRPLVMEYENFSIATNDPNYDWSRLSRVDAPPMPTWMANMQPVDANQKMYWEDMGRFIWNVVITESHH